MAEIKLSRITFFALCILLAVSGAQLFAQKNTIREKKIDEVKKKYEIHASYPQMDVPKDALMGERGTMMDFNRPIENIITARTDGFRKEIKTMQVPRQKRKSSLSIGYETPVDNSKTYSIKFEIFSDIDFAAHPNSFYDSYNFDFVNWMPFTLKDIFPESAAYLNFISDYCKADLKKQAKEGWDADLDAEIEKGASVDLKNFETFNISDTDLIITFQYYQVGPRIIGAPVVSIPLDSIKSMINPAGPLGYLTGK